jgi:hypothetical protein
MTQTIADVVSRVVTVEELRDAVNRPIDPAERDDVLALVRWFTTRYPSAEERLAYVRQASARWRPSPDVSALVDEERNRRRT